MSTDISLERRIADLVRQGFNREGDILDLFAQGKLEPPANQTETAYLNAVAYNVPLLAQVGIPKSVITNYVYHSGIISQDRRSQDGGTEKARITYMGKYMLLLQQDLIGLKNNGLNEDGMNNFVKYATRTCFVGRAEHDHLTEGEREENYVNIVKAINTELNEKRPAFMKDQGTQVRQIFEHTVYGDNISGIRETKTHTVDFLGGSQ